MSSTITSVNYANWFQRAGAIIIDMLCYMALPFLGLLISSLFSDDSAFVYIYAPLLVAGIVLNGYNRWFLAGKTGQSWGRRALGIRLVSQRTGQPIGAGMAFVRELAHFLDSVVLYIGWLWPAFDSERQTFADKVTGTIVVR